MKLKGEYTLKINVELPDGSYTDIQNLIDFFMKHNDETIYKLNRYSDIKYFDNVYDKGCLESDINVNWLRQYFINRGFVNVKYFEIVDRASILHDLYTFKEYAETYVNNKEALDREVKIDIINK